jgi:chemotaxis protein CheX
MQAKYINPFIKASINLFEKHLGLKVTYDKPFLNPDRDKLMDVSSIIGLAGDAKGAIVLSFSRQTAIAIISIFSGTKYKALTKEVIDGVGELTNIVAGNAKKDLDEYKISISLPGVITGKGYQIHWPRDIPVITIPYHSQVGDFTLNVSFKG